MRVDAGANKGTTGSGQQPALDRLLRDVKRLNKEYRALTGRPLGVTGEVAELEAARILGLELCEARTAGHDAIRCVGSSQTRVQIKGRCVLPDSKAGQRVGAIKPEADWDIVVLVLMDEDLETTEIFEATRPAIVRALREPGSQARNERGALAVTKFKSIGRRIWSRSSGRA
ncbi:MAG: hypothetical protein EPO68_06865 [Planctomycetota bacterium]|nr:MAG: hypothetical protein EPO68_06865 [Planctomycetota bacterium]